MARSLCLLIGLLLLSGWAIAQDEPAVDLRGPGPKVGRKVRELFQMEMKDVDVQVRSGGELIVTAKMDLSTSEESETTVKAMDGRLVTKFETRVLKDETTRTTNGEAEEEVGPLAGQVVISERLKSGWKHSLAEGEPTEEQQEELTDWSPWDDEEAIPEGKQKIGATWEMDAVQLKKAIGNSISALSGKANVTFTGLKKIDNDLCAVIETVGSIKGKIKDEGAGKVVSMELKLTEYRSLASGVTLKTEGDVALKASGKEKIGDGEFDIVMQGKGKMSSVIEVRK